MMDIYIMGYSREPPAAVQKIQALQLSPSGEAMAFRVFSSTVCTFTLHEHSHSTLLVKLKKNRGEHAALNCSDSGMAIVSD